MTTTRRKFLKSSALFGAGLLLPWKAAQRASAAIPGGTLDPLLVPKFQMPMFIPPAMPRSQMFPARTGVGIDYYEIAAAQFRQQILPRPLPATITWGYGSVNHPASFCSPSYTIEATVNKPVRVKWINRLVDASGNYLRPLVPVDPTLHWANPPGPVDSTPSFGATPGPYTGPVPMVVHLHGAHVAPHSDGYPEAWYLPNARNIPAGYFTKGSHFDQIDPSNRIPGTAVYEYRNDQRAGTLWYHDHTMGMTRCNVYAGLQGMYVLRGGASDLKAGVLPGGAFEIPLAIADRSFNDDGSLFYPSSRAFFDGFTGPFIPDSDMPPIWNAEFFGNMMLVNGRAWPVLRVEPRRYRFRILNACNSRFLILKFSHPRLTFWQIGTEGGFLPAPVQLPQLLVGKAERADVIVDFTGLPAGTEIVLQNIGPDEPYGGGVPDVDFAASDPMTTGQVMKFVVGSRRGVDWTVPPNELALPAITPLGAPTRVRQLSINEMDSGVLAGVGPLRGMLGTFNQDGTPNPLMWEDPVTENPVLGETEMWELHNFTADAHPIHVHQVQFQVVNREPMGGVPRDPESWETGFKDTVVSYPGEITRLKARFDIPGLYVWHCHILEHEDNDMMRPIVVA
ncbi:MAG: multicopper oxidase domain-containing protein [Verrucomicrobia bacterium]|nr:multicopper oxidase domain-containing protein [Verrucomicrobiota bacterium]